MATTAAAYSVRRNKLSGRSSVHFVCDGCKADVNCPLGDAGTIQQCPMCHHPFRVPGEAELAVERRAEERKAEETKRDAIARSEESRRKSAIGAAAMLRASTVAAQKNGRTPRTWSLSITGLLMFFVGAVLSLFGAFADSSVAGSSAACGCGGAS